MGIRQSTEQELIRKYGLNPNVQDQDGNTNLHLAIVNNNKTSIKELLNHPNINVNIQNNVGVTPLHLALFFKKKNLARELINRPDTDVNIQTNSVNAALHYLVKYQDIELVKALLNRPDASVNIRNNSGNTALHYFTRYKNVELAKELLKHPNINVNIQNNAGNTALHIAVINSDELVKALLEYPNINVNIRNNIGNTALNNAAHLYKVDIIPMLLNRSDLYYSNIGSTDKTAFQYILRNESQEHPVMINAFIEAGAYSPTDVAYIENKYPRIWKLYKNKFQSVFATLDEGPLSGMPQVISSLVAETLYPGVPFW